MKAMPLLLFAIIATTFAQPEAPAAHLAKRYASQLDHIERYCRQTNCFSDERFWRESARVARQASPEIVHAIMLRSRKWRDEEGLLYVPLVAFLPRRPTMKILRHYQRSAWEMERIWAGEFITELDEPGTRKAIRALSGSRQ